MQSRRAHVLSSLPAVPPPIDASSWSTAHPLAVPAPDPAAEHTCVPSLPATESPALRIAQSLSLLAGAPGTGMRRAVEVGASTLGGALAGSLAGGGLSFCGWLPLFGQHPALGENLTTVVLGVCLVTAVPGAALGAAAALDRPAPVGTRPGAIAMASAIGLVSGWAWGTSICSALIWAAGGVERPWAASAHALVTHLVGVAAGLCSAYHAGRETAFWAGAFAPAAVDATDTRPSRSSRSAGLPL